MKELKTVFFGLLLGLILLSCLGALPQLKLPAKHLVGHAIQASYPGDADDRALAERFAPIWHQRFTGDAANKRFDYITNFDFDGDWIGNNNWEHSAQAKYPMKGYVYYSVIESQSYYFITYADFHARDWSLLQPLIDESMNKVQASDKLAQWLPPDLRARIEVNHENDLEGVQVIVSKDEEMHVVGVETIAHNRFERYAERDIEFDGEHPHVYVESQKHGVYSYPHQAKGMQALFDVGDGPIRLYRYKGVAEDPDKVTGDIGYDLQPVYTTFWKMALAAPAPDKTFGDVADLGEEICKRLGCRLAKIGITLRGDVAGKNRASLPWGWIDTQDPELSNGPWFLDPVLIIPRHFPRARPAGEYVSNPYLGVFRR